MGSKKYRNRPAARMAGQKHLVPFILTKGMSVDEWVNKNDLRGVYNSIKTSVENCADNSEEAQETIARHCMIFLRQELQRRAGL